MTKYNRLNRIYHKLKWRCFYPTNPLYKDYGGRGIIICDEWMSSFEVFKAWAMNNGYNEKLTLDRVDNDGNYEPSNCQWISQKLQNINQRKRKDNTSKFVGVSLKGNKWQTSIAINKKSIYLGLFNTPEEASEAYQKAKKERDELYLKEEKDLENINYRKVSKF